MKKLLLAALLACSFVGCSQEEAPPPPPPPVDDAQEDASAAPAPAPVAAAPQPMGGGDIVLQDLNNIQLELQNDNYDTAVSSLSAIGNIPNMTPEQARAYRAQLQATQDYLMQRMQADQAARDAYSRLGRQSMGR
ncbi:MAG: hypothetical protein ACO34E_16705 [Limisphaerales bacterium]|jgi:hypothetical protein